MKSRVFFVIGRNSKKRFDLESSKKWGESVFLDVTRSPLSPDHLLKDLISALEENAFDPDNDYVAMTGPLIEVALFFGAALTSYEEIRLLIFDARNNCYVARGLTTSESKP